MLVDLNYELYLVHIKTLAMASLSGQENQILKGQMDQDLTRRIWMVLGEGAVFVALLILGIRKVRSALATEMELARTQNNFLLSITHELKSPLAALKLQLQTLKTRQLDPEKQQQILDRSLKESERLHMLVEDLLLTTRIDSGNGNLNMEKLDLSEVVDILIKDHYSIHVASARVRTNFKDKCEVFADRQAVISIATNLIDNALKYTPSDTVINVSVSCEKNMALLTVKDQGPGIPDAERDKIFERFYRAGNEETRNAKGTGLGLYIVARLAQEMNGSVTLTSHEPIGCHLTVRLPLQEF